MPSLPLPEGIHNFAEFGRLMKWGKGDDQARARAREITLAWVRNAGIGFDIAFAWRDMYLRVKLFTPGNPSAQGRAELMQRIIDLLGGQK